MEENIEKLKQALERARQHFVICEFNDTFAHHIGMCIIGNPDQIHQKTEQAKKDYEKALQDYRRKIIKTVRTCQFAKGCCYDFNQIQTLIKFINKFEKAKLYEEKKSLLIASHQSVEEKIEDWYNAIFKFFSELPAHKKALSILFSLPPSIATSPLLIRALIGIFLSSLSERALGKLSVKCEKGSCTSEMNQFLNDLIASKASSEIMDKLVAKLDKKIRDKKLEIALEKLKPHTCNLFLPCKIIPEAGMSILEILKKM